MKEDGFGPKLFSIAVPSPVLRGSMSQVRPLPLTLTATAQLSWLLEVMPGDKDLSESDQKARVIIEKKTVINLLEAFAVSVKHYLRGEDGIHYTDLYHLVKFLPAYALPHGIPSPYDLTNTEDPPMSSATHGSSNHLPSGPTNGLTHRISTTVSLPDLPLPATSHPPKRPTFLPSSPSSATHFTDELPIPKIGQKEKGSTVVGDEVFLLPARMPPKYHIFDLFPFSLLVQMMTKKGKEVKGKKAARLRAKLRDNTISHNLPLEISLYLVSNALVLILSSLC
jgi:putative membrane protein